MDQLDPNIVDAVELRNKTEEIGKIVSILAQGN